MQHESSVPVGYCQCGCGEQLTAAGDRRGSRFRRGHGTRGRQQTFDRYRVEDRGYDTACWIWTLSFDGRGYGQLSFHGRNWKAYRWHWEQANGPTPAGMELDHLCGNRACVKPEHLEPVPHVINSQRGRNAKLTMEKAQQIRAKAAAGESRLELAAEYGVARETIAGVLANRRWVVT